MGTTEDKVTSYLRKISTTLVELFLKPKSTELQRAVFEKFVTIFHANFVVWIEGMQSSCISSDGKTAASNILEIELNENREQMLLNFMAQINVHPSSGQQKKLQPNIDKINEVMQFGVKYKTGAGPATVIYMLEESSKKFIPWMEKVARALQATDLTFFEKYSFQCDKRASLALEAVKAEDAVEVEKAKDTEVVKKEVQEAKDIQVDKAFAAVYNLLLAIFFED